MDHQNSDNRIRPAFLIIVGGVLVAGLIPLGISWANKGRPTPAVAPVETPAVAAPVGEPAAAAPSVTLEEQWGIQVSGIGLSQADSALHFRYQIVAPEKAIRLARSKVNAYLLDLASGARIPMGSPPADSASPAVSRLGTTPGAALAITSVPARLAGATSAVDRIQAYREADRARMALSQEMRKVRWAAIAEAQGQNPASATTNEEPAATGIFPPPALLAAGNVNSLRIPNPGGVLRRGSKVALVIGNVRTPDLTVQ